MARDYTDPNQPLVLSYSTLQSRMTCAQQWHYQRGEGLRLASADENIVFDVGSCVSRVMEEALWSVAPEGQCLPDMVPAGLAAEIAWRQDAPIRDARRRTATIKKVAGCAEALLKWIVNAPQSRGARVVGIERTWSRWLRRPQRLAGEYPDDPSTPWVYTRGDTGIALMAKPDLVLQREDVVAWDWKTSTQDTSRTRQGLDLQAHIYALVLEPEYGRVLCAQVRSQLCDPDPPKMVDTTPGAPWADDPGEQVRARVLGEAWRLAVDHGLQVRAGVHPRAWSIYGSACGTCAYRDLCEADMGGDRDRVEAAMRAYQKPAAETLDEPYF